MTDQTEQTEPTTVEDTTDWKSQARKWEQRAKTWQKRATELEASQTPNGNDSHDPEPIAEDTERIAHLEAQLAQSNRTNLVQRLITQHGLRSEDHILLSGTDETTLRRQAEALERMTSSKSPSSMKPADTDKARETAHQLFSNLD